MASLFSRRDPTAGKTTYPESDSIPLLSPHGSSSSLASQDSDAWSASAPSGRAARRVGPAPMSDAQRAAAAMRDVRDPGRDDVVPAPRRAWEGFSAGTRSPADPRLLASAPVSPVAGSAAAVAAAPDDSVHIARQPAADPADKVDVNEMKGGRFPWEQLLRTVTQMIGSSGITSWLR